MRNVLLGSCADLQFGEGRDLVLPCEMGASMGGRTSGSAQLSVNLLSCFGKRGILKMSGFCVWKDLYMISTLVVESSEEVVFVHRIVCECTVLYGFLHRKPKY